jgi:hypothetical protein
VASGGAVGSGESSVTVGPGVGPLFFLGEGWGGRGVLGAEAIYHALQNDKQSLEGICEWIIR